MPQSIHNFNIVRKLGNQKTRKFGEVFLLESTDGKKAVLKLVRKTSSNEKIAERLRHEANFSFEHEQLPTVLSFAETSSELALILDYRTGIPLSDWGKGLTSKERRKRVLELLNAILVPLKAIHQHNILHLDLKPDNLLVSETSEGLKISIIDFGMATDLNSPEERGTLFSLPYSSPELILNQSKVVGFSSDFFSLGIVIYHFLEQKLPFQSGNPSIYTNLQLAHPIPDIQGISKAQNLLLKELTAKPVFRTSPNLLDEKELSDALDGAIKKRLSAMDHFQEEWQKHQQKSLLQRFKR